MYRKIGHIIAFLTCSALFFACEEPDCVSELDDTIHLTFFKLNQNERDTVFVTSLATLGRDSLLLENQPNITEVDIPANPDTSAITLIFDVREYGVDTLTLTYQNGARLISEDCGFELIYSELSYSRNDFDSISVRNNILAEAIDENIRVYNN